MKLKPLALTLAVSALALTPVLPVYDLDNGGAAYAEKGGNGGGKGGGGNGGGKGGGKSEGKSKKSEKSEKQAGKKNAKTTAAGDEVVKTKGKPVVAEGELAPNQLGKMNGAMNANINAVLAHIRNGQTTNGPVGLLAGLAIADAGVAALDGEAGTLQAKADAFNALDAGLATAGYATVEDYLQAKADGTVDPDPALEDLIAATGGTTGDGLALAETRPTDEELTEALEAEADALQAQADAEAAIGEAWNKDGDLDALLGMMRERLAADQEAIDAAIAETQPDETAEVLPEEEAPVEEEIIVVVE